MTDAARLLAMLRLGDSAFPGGSASFSWGLETLVADGFVRRADDLSVFVSTQLRGRWATTDRSALVATWEAGGDIERIGVIDRIVDARTLARELREGSVRAGNAMLSVHRRIGTPGSAEIQAAQERGALIGHLAVMQGCLWRLGGIERDAAVLMSAHAMCLAATGAAIRLGIVGHVDAQRIMTAAAPLIGELGASEPPPIGDIHAFVPLTEIAAMRHETGETRLFSN